MKKTIIALTLVAAAALSSQAQGLVLFTSGTQNSVTNNVNPALGAIASGRIQGAGNFYFALFYSASATTVAGNSAAFSGTNGVYAWSDPSWTAVSGLAANSATAGRFLPLSPNADGSTTIPTVAGGTTAQFLVVGWSANLGSTLLDARNAFTAGQTAGFIGQSVISGPISLGNGGSLPTPALFGGVAPSIQGFTLGSIVAVPEPGTLALAALGGASLLMFRRKK